MYRSIEISIYIYLLIDLGRRQETFRRRRNFSS